MDEPFFYETRADWLLCDPNHHMRNSAFLDLSVHCRMRFFEENGFAVEEFERRRIGPVIRSDHVDYRREVRHLDPIRIELWLDGASPRMSRFRFRNVVLRDGGESIAAVITTEAGWLDLAARKLINPSDDLVAVMNGIKRTPEYEELPESVR